MNSSGTIEAVSWDMDGTLVDSEPLHARAISHVIADLGYEPPDGLAQRIAGEAAEETHAWICKEFGLWIGSLDWIERKYRVYLVLVDELFRSNRRLRFGTN